MLIKQVSVFLENAPGTLRELTRLLGEGGLDLMALSIADTQNFGIVRIIVTDGQVDPALEILRSNGYTCRVNNVVCAVVEDRPLGLNDLLEKIYIERRKELLGEGVVGAYDLLRLQKPLVRYAATAKNPAGHFSWGLAQLDGYNGSDAEPVGTLPSNDYRFLMQIPQMEIANNESVSTSDQNPFSGQ